MANNTDDILQDSQLFDEASEKFRQCLNKVISDMHLPPQVVLSLLARISAGFTHQFQRTVSDPHVKDSIEDSFMENYNLFLYDFDQHDVDDVIGKINKKGMN